ncbi:MAG: DUF2027 domain-containing protein [Prevotella sp.]|nr:DUF2027 domain-containing protein [Prevotella sp.]
MKIGDKVRFLSETGGGIVAGFQGKNIVLVEDEDGFQIPTAINDVVVVTTDDYNIAKVHTEGTTKRPSEPATKASKEEEPADKPVTFRKMAYERKGGDVLSLYLAFLPLDIKMMTCTRFEAYLVNDSNFYLQYALLKAENNTWNMWNIGEVEPNTSIFIDEFGHEDINSMERVAIQAFAFKRDKGFSLKPTVNVQIRVDTKKFYKLHAFMENDFFETPALLYNIVVRDEVAKPLVVDAKKLKQEMYAKAEDIKHQKVEAQNDYVRRYDDSQSKGKAPLRAAHEGIVVVDLHINELLDTTVGMSAADILNYQLDVFRNTLSKYAGKKGQKLVFIHGKGEGVLRQAIVHELNYKYKQYPHQDASFREYGYGATQVTIK